LIFNGGQLTLNQRVPSSTPVAQVLYMIGRFKDCVRTEPDFGACLIERPHTVWSLPRLIRPVHLSLSKTQIRTYRWCSPAGIGKLNMRPALWTSREIGATDWALFDLSLLVDRRPDVLGDSVDL
jgi:hypothetical protein